MRSGALFNRMISGIPIEEAEPGIVCGAQISVQLL